MWERKLILSNTIFHIFSAITKSSFTSPPPLFHPSPSAVLMQLLSLVSATHLCVPSDMNHPEMKAHCVSASWLLALNRRTYCQEFLLQLRHLALTVAEKLLTLSEAFSPYSQASWWQVWETEAVVSGPTATYWFSASTSSGSVVQDKTS